MSCRKRRVRKEVSNRAQQNNTNIEGTDCIITFFFTYSLQDSLQGQKNIKLVIFFKCLTGDDADAD